MIPSSWRGLVLTFVMYFPSALSATVLSDSNGIYSIPTRMAKETDLLEEHSRFMSGSMKTSISPCEDFYEFACGNWHNNSMIPEDARNTTFYYAMDKMVDDLLIGFLKNTSDTKENIAENKAKRFFASCMNMSHDLSQGYTMLWDSLKDPAAKDGKPLDWIALNFYSNYEVHGLLPLTATFNVDSLMYDIFISSPEAILTKPSKFNFTSISKDFKLKNKDKLETELEELKIFEKELISSASSFNFTVIESIGEFMIRHNSSKINWEKFFNLTFNGTFNDSWKIQNNVKDLTRLNKFLRKSKKDILLKYVKWLNIQKFYVIWKTETHLKTVESKCLKLTLKYFDEALIPWYIETTFDEDRRADLLHIFKRLKDTFYSNVDQYSWLDNETRSGVKSKIRAMDSMIGYTDTMVHRKSVNDKYKDTNITSNYWKNLMNLENSGWSEFIGKTFSDPIEKSYITNVNGYYVYYLNAALLTMGLSQLPYYHIKLPNSLKFGGIGNVIGHEIIHGFDSNLYYLNYDGRSKSWWSWESFRNFKERYQCLESQYNKFIYNGVRTNAKRTASENIADNGGIRIAYRSYLRFLSENPDLESATDKPLPGMDFNNKQLFFLKFAQFYCDGQSLETRMKSVECCTHTYNKFRVMGPLMNMPEFSEEFNCPIGTGMNPLKKCVVW